MKIYLNDDGQQLFDRHMIELVLGVNRSKVHRELKKIDDKVEVPYKNQYLYDEQTLLKLMERVLIERLTKMEQMENGL